MEAHFVGGQMINRLQVRMTGERIMQIIPHSENEKISQRGHGGVGVRGKNDLTRECNR